MRSSGVIHSGFDMIYKYTNWQTSGVYAALIEEERIVILCTKMIFIIYLGLSKRCHLHGENK